MITTKQNKDTYAVFLPNSSKAAAQAASEAADE